MKQIIPESASMQHPDPQPASRAGRIALALLLALVSSSCVYRMTVQQGNYLDPKALEQLQLGMTRSQVRYLLGTPMVPDAFDDDRWDYLYYLEKKRLGKPERRLLTVYFESDKVARIEREGLPAATAPSDPVAADTTPGAGAEAPSGGAASPDAPPPST